jgi:hypothetical protein
MAEKWLTAVVAIALGIVGLATLAVLVSRQAQTAGVITGGAGAFKNALCAALSPIGVNCGTITAGLTPDVNSTITFPSAGTTFPFGGGGAGASTFGLGGFSQ